MKLLLSRIRTTLVNKSHTTSQANKLLKFRAYTMASSSSCPNPSTTTQPATQPTLSSTYDPTQASKDLASLLKSPSSHPEEEGGKWTLTPNGKGIERAFKFKTFKKTWEFMNLIAPECAVQKHHPEWSNVYNTTFIRWTTHSPPGLSEKDVVMARFCDVKAVECGEVVVVGEEKGGVGRGLVDRVAVEGGECCVPKKKLEQ